MNDPIQTEPETPTAAAEPAVQPDPTDLEAFDLAFDDEPEAMAAPKKDEPPPAEDGADDDPLKDSGPAVKPSATEPSAPAADDDDKDMAALADKYKSDSPSPPPPPPPPPPSEPVVPSGVDLEGRVAEALNVAEAEWNGTKVNAKEFETDFMEESTYIKARVMGVVKPLVKEVETLTEELRELRYWQALQDAHPGARQIARTDEFNKWLKEQPESIQRASLTLDPDDAIVILNAYQKAIRGKAVAGAKEKQAEERRRKVAIHGSTITGAGTRGPGGGTKKQFNNEMDEFNDAWNEATG
jgi:hypothetical protein